LSLEMKSRGWRGTSKEISEMIRFWSIHSPEKKWTARSIFDWTNISTSPQLLHSRFEGDLNFHRKNGHDTWIWRGDEYDLSHSSSQQAFYGWKLKYTSTISDNSTTNQVPSPI
jgi:hypothetical protein